MSAVLQMDDVLVSGKSHIEQAFSKPADPHRFLVSEDAVREATLRSPAVAHLSWDPDAIHNAAFHCADYKDFCNRMLDECWPLLRAQLYQDFLFRKVPTPILEHTALVHPTPWDWDVRPCARCGKLVGTPVMKTKRAWLGNDYCVACERIILGEAS